MTTAIVLPVGNRVLASLPPESAQRLRPTLKPVVMSLGDTLMRPGEQINRVYFPTAGYASLMFDFSTGLSSEVGMIGCDGVVGSSLVLSNSPSCLTALVQCAGSAYWMEADCFKAAIDDDNAFARAMLLYSQTLMDQMALTAACNCKHTVRQRLAKWILMARDRSDTDVMPMTQEMLAVLLGSHRPSITEAAAFLRREGVIGYAQGRVTITDRAALESYACECHLLPTVTGPRSQLA